MAVQVQKTTCTNLHKPAQPAQKLDSPTLNNTKSCSKKNCNQPHISLDTNSHLTIMGNIEGDGNQVEAERWNSLTQRTRRITMDFNTPKYSAICKKLGFRPETQYVRITRAGTVEPTAGTRSEAFSLWKAVKTQGLNPSKRFQQIAKREGF